MNKIDLTERKILNTIRKYNMISQGDRVLVGLSGGKDSVALLYSLYSLSRILDIELVAFHLNHGIRGEEACRDEEFARRFSESINVDFLSCFVDVPSVAQNSSLGIEAVAREIRYKQFEKNAIEKKCNKIATAHTSSDNSETFLINLLRNGNAKGIPPVRDNIVRPLIELTTEEVIDYCENNNLSFVTDSTNNEEQYTRNFIRNNVIPSLKELQPSFDNNILRETKIRRSYEELCKREVEKYFFSTSDPLSINSLKKLAVDNAYTNVLYEVLSAEAERLNAKISYSQFLQIIDVLGTSSVGSKVMLDNDVVAILDYDRLLFKKIEDNCNEFYFEVSVGANPIPNSNVVLYLELAEDYQKRISNVSSNDIKINKLAKNTLIKYNIINSPLFARTRMVGDEYVFGGITRNIKKYMINEKIPQSLRSSIPIVCDKEGIVWIPGLGIADRLKEQEGEVYSLSIDFTK